MQRRIKQTHGHRTVADDFVHLVEVFFQHRTNLIQRFLTRFFIISENHFTHNVDAIPFKEHVFGTAETDALCTEFNRLFCVTRRIRVGAHLKTLDLIYPTHKFAEIAGQRRCFRRHFAFINSTRRTVERECIGRGKYFSVNRQRLGVVVNA